MMQLAARASREEVGSAEREQLDSEFERVSEQLARVVAERVGQPEGGAALTIVEGLAPEQGDYQQPFAEMVARLRGLIAEAGKTQPREQRRPAAHPPPQQATQGAVRAQTNQARDNVLHEQTKAVRTQGEHPPDLAVTLLK